MTADAIQIEPLLVALVAAPILLILLILLLLPKRPQNMEVTLMELYKRLGTILLSLLIIMMLLPMTVFSAGSIDLNRCKSGHHLSG